MIEDTSFGEVTIDGKTYDYDVVVFPDSIIRRKKSITKEKHGTSHKFTRAEMKVYLEEVDPSNINSIVVGTGQYDKLKLLPEARQLLEEKDLEYIERKTPDLVGMQDHPRENNIFIIHVTC
ncbi:MAG: MTH938/NDUFAF3 family protein [Candidatus Natronoplasma sp.]